MCKNVVGYYRTSSTTNVKGDSRTRQSVSVKNYSKTKGWNVKGEFYDVISGTTHILERKEFVEMLSYCLTIILLFQTFIKVMGITIFGL